MMDKRMGFDIAYMNTHKLGLDDTIQFRCKACGKCCKHRDDVILTPYDLFRIARFLVRTPLEVIERYCVVYDGKDSHIPLVKIDPVPPDNACPFLRDRKCIVHKDKPLVCAVYPLARATGPEGPFYVLKPDVKCGGNDRTVSVRDWIGPVRNDESDEFSVLWFDVINAISRPLHKQWETFSNERKEELLTLFYNLIYLNYNTREAFLPQFKYQATGAMLYATTYGAIDIPEWAPIPENSSDELKYTLLLHKAYFSYRKNWCTEHETTVYAIDEEIGVDGGSCYVCLSEFEGAEFQTEACMQTLLAPNDFLLWKQLKESDE